MTKLSISLAAVMLSVTLAPAAQAYSTESGPQLLYQISKIKPLGPQSVKVEDACTLLVTPILASILGLQDDGRPDQKRPPQSTVACAQQ